MGGSQAAGASSTFFNQVFIPETFVNPKSDEDDIKEEQESESEGNTSIEDALFHFDCQDKQAGLSIPFFWIKSCVSIVN